MPKRPYGACGVYAVHDRHVQVHQHQVKALFLQALNGDTSVFREIGQVAHALEQDIDKLAVDLVVLDHQYAIQALRFGRWVQSEYLGLAGGQGRLCPLRSHPQGKTRTHALRTRDLDLPPHQARQGL